MTSLLVIIAILVVVAIIVMVMYNSLVSLRNEAESGWSGIDVQLKRRNDLIPNLVETVKGYASHEKETLDAVIRARQASVAAEGVEDNAAADNMLTAALGKMFALSEAYPDLKANENFVSLQNELSATEDKIAAARRLYNNVVQRYNTKIESVPTNMVAKLGTFPKRDFYEIEDPIERQNVRVSFS